MGKTSNYSIFYIFHLMCFLFYSVLWLNQNPKNKIHFHIFKNTMQEIQKFKISCSNLATKSSGLVYVHSSQPCTFIVVWRSVFCHPNLHLDTWCAHNSADNTWRITIMSPKAYVRVSVEGAIHDYLKQKRVMLYADNRQKHHLFPSTNTQR